MADSSVTANAGSGGAKFATFVDGSSVNWPYSLAAWNEAGTVTKVAAATPLPVDGSGVTQPVSGTVTADAGTGTFATSNAILDAAAYAQNDAIGSGRGVLGMYNASGNAVFIGGAASAAYGIIRDAAGNSRGANVNSSNQLLTAATLQAGTNALGKLAANSGVDIGDVDVTSISAGANLIGDVGISGARTSGGTTPYKNLDVDESEDEVKGTAGQVYWIHAINLATAVRYLKFYNATAANVTVGTTTPVLTLPIPTQAATANGAGFMLSVPNGIAFGTAITIAATTGFADNDSGAPGTNEVIVNLGYA